MSWEDRLLLMIYPELRQYALKERGPALERARKGEFDTVERVGILLAVILVALLTRYSAQGLGLVQVFGAALANFVAALCLLLVSAGPLLRRRTRRHLALGLRGGG